MKLNKMYMHEPATQFKNQKFANIILDDIYCLNVLIFNFIK